MNTYEDDRGTIEARSVSIWRPRCTEPQPGRFDVTSTMEMSAVSLSRRHRRCAGVDSRRTAGPAGILLELNLAGTLLRLSPWNLCYHHTCSLHPEKQALRLRPAT